MNLNEFQMNTCLLGFQWPSTLCMSFPFFYLWTWALMIVPMFPAGGLWHGGLLPCHSVAGGGRQSLPRILRTVEYRGWGKPGGCLGSPGLCLFPGRGASETHCFHHNKWNALHLLYNFLSIFMSLNLFHLPNSTKCESSRPVVLLFPYFTCE